MSDYNNQNNLDKRLKQDDVEQEKKANASTGMLIAALVIIVGILVGIYLYNRPVEVQTVTHETTVQTAPVTTATPEASPVAPAEATTPATVTTTTTPADVPAPADTTAQ